MISKTNQIYLPEIHDFYVSNYNDLIVFYSQKYQNNKLNSNRIMKFSVRPKIGQFLGKSQGEIDQLQAKIEPTLDLKLENSAQTNFLGVFKTRTKAYFVFNEMVEEVVSTKIGSFCLNSADQTTPNFSKIKLLCHSQVPAKIIQITDNKIYGIFQNFDQIFICQFDKLKILAAFEAENCSSDVYTSSKISGKLAGQKIFAEKLENLSFSGENATSISAFYVRKTEKFNQIFLSLEDGSFLAYTTPKKLSQRNSVKDYLIFRNFYSQKVDKISILDDSLNNQNTILLSLDSRQVISIKMPEIACEKMSNQICCESLKNLNCEWLAVEKAGAYKNSRQNLGRCLPGYPKQLNFDYNLPTSIYLCLEEIDFKNFSLPGWKSENFKPNLKYFTDDYLKLNRIDLSQSSQISKIILLFFTNYSTFSHYYLRVSF